MIMAGGGAGANAGQLAQGQPGVAGAKEEKDEIAVANCSHSLMTLLDNSPDFAKVFAQLQRLPSQHKEEVFERVAKRLRSGVEKSFEGGGGGECIGGCK